jgi:hypothetical protein
MGDAMTEGSLAPYATLAVRIPGSAPWTKHLTGTEPCESCRTALLIGNLPEALADVLEPRAATIRGNRMLERHVVYLEVSTAIVWREHTIDRCRLAQLGHPEPLDLTDDDGVDDD